MARISSNPVRVVRMIAVLIIGITVGIFYLAVSSKKKAEAKQIAAASTAASTSVTRNSSVQLTKVLVPRFDGFTPCDPQIDFAFELDTQGDPISLKFPGVEMAVEYSGKGTLNAPERRTSGPVHVTSLDTNKQARVRIWEVVVDR